MRQIFFFRCSEIGFHDSPLLGKWNTLLTQLVSRACIDHGPDAGATEDEGRLRDTHHLAPRVDQGQGRPAQRPQLPQHTGRHPGGADWLQGVQDGGETAQVS